MSFIKIDDSNYYYEYSCGDTKKETVIFISGLKADHASWSTITAEISKYYNILTIDNRGIGQTKDNKKVFSLDDLACDIYKMMESLKIDMPHIVGHSMGGAIAQVLAYQYPEKISSVVLCNTFNKFSEKAGKFFSEDVKSLYANNKTQGEIMEQIIPWVFAESFISPALINLIKDMSNQNAYPQTMQDYCRQCEALMKFNSADWASFITVPVLIIGSKEDKTALLQDSEMLHHLIPGSALKILEGGHASAIEQPQALLDNLLSFWRS